MEKNCNTCHRDNNLRIGICYGCEWKPKYETLEARIKELEEKNNELVSCLKDGESCISEFIKKSDDAVLFLQGKIKKLETENRETRSCLEFYSKTSNWCYSEYNGVNEGKSQINPSDNSFCIDRTGKNLYFGGKRARETLAKLEKGMRNEKIYKIRN